VRLDLLDPNKIKFKKKNKLLVKMFVVLFTVNRLVNRIAHRPTLRSQTQEIDQNDELVGGDSQAPLGGVEATERHEQLRQRIDLRMLQ